ncbi:MAG TPA: hypothetical protein PJ988_23290, partial [Anaerolinea sp.]|nr:hypothetical protein [Anaerolinea sp.]
MPEVKHDMAILKRSGFNLANLQVGWIAAEPLESRYDFSRSQELIEEAARLDLAVCVSLDFEPAPGALEDQQRYLTRLVETLGKYENVVAWNMRQAANSLLDQAEAIRAADPLQRPILAQQSGFAPARAQDFLAAACYPAQAPFHPWDDAAPRAGQPAERAATLLNEAAGVALTFDTIRSCNPPGAPLWAAEFQGGPVNGFLHLGRTPESADIRRWMLGAAASGVTAISFRASGGEGKTGEPSGTSLL